MFCCTKKESHFGEIVNSICLQQQCCKSKNQLLCIACLQQDHQDHNVSSMKKIIPQLLNAHTDKHRLSVQMEGMLKYVKMQFGEENAEGQATVTDNLVERVTQILTDMKKQIEVNNQEINKMKNIFKTLNKNVTPTTSHMVKAPSSSIKKLQEDNASQKYQSSESPKKQESKLNQTSTIPMQNRLINPSSSKYKNLPSNPNAAIDLFSNITKHPYVSISSSQKTALKASHSGHRFAAITSKCLSPNQCEVRVVIDSSTSGNIMVGLCHESIVKAKEYANCYGTSSGTYLIGQNSSSPSTSISFHHSLSQMNRKEIVGWNFEAGDELIVGYNFQDQIVYFKKDVAKKGKLGQFAMQVRNQDSKPAIDMLLESGLKFIVLLQNQGDQVSLSDV